MFEKILLAATSSDAAAAAAAGTILTGFLIFWIIMWIIGILGFIFWVIMLIDAIRRTNWKQESDKTLWILIIVLVGLLGAIIYYFAEKRPLDHAAKKQ